MVRSSVFVVALAVFTLSLSHGSVRAQSSSEVATARALFRQGLAAARQGRWEEALERFERSYAITERATTLLNLAGAQVQTGHLVAGAESYRRFLAEARHGREARYRPQAERALAEVEPRLGRIVVEVDGLADGDVISLDGEALSRAALGVEVPVDPGTRTLTVQQGDTERARAVVRIEEGERREITLDASVDVQVVAAQSPAVPAAAMRADAEPAASPDDDGGLWIGLGVGVGVVVAVAAAVGIALAVDSSSASYTGNLGAGWVQFE